MKAAVRTRREAVYSQDYFRKVYPEVAEAFEQVMAEHRHIKTKFISSYKGYHNPTTGRARGVSLASVLETLEAFGYNHTIIITKTDI